MNFKVNISYDNSKLKELQKKVREFNSEHEVPLSELFPDDFIREYTDFKNLQAMIDTCGIEKLKEPDNPEFTKFISTHTRFNTWKEMLDEAGIRYYKRKLGF